MEKLRSLVLLGLASILLLGLLCGCAEVSSEDNIYVAPARPFAAGGRMQPSANAIPPEF